MWESPPQKKEEKKKKKIVWLNLSNNSSSTLLADGHNRVEVIEQLAIHTEFKDEENVGDALEHVDQLDDVLVAWNQPQNIHFPHSLLLQREPIPIHRIFRHVDYLCSKGLPCLF